MRLGFLEIGIIIAVVLIVFGVTRIMKPGRGSARKNETSTEAERQKGNDKTWQARHPRLKITGFVLVLIGIAILLAGVNLIKWVFWGNIWALIIVATGLTIVFITRRK